MKKPHHPLRKLSLAAAFFAAVSGLAALVPTEWRHRQEFTVAAPGVVEVKLPDATFDAAQPDLRDLRIIDAHSREAPYLLDRSIADLESNISQPRFFRPKSIERPLFDDMTQMVIETGSTHEFEALELETSAPFFLKAAHVEISNDGNTWLSLGAETPIFRQFGAEQLRLALGRNTAAFIRLSLDDWNTRPIIINEVKLVPVSAPATPSLVAVGAQITRREEFAGETVLTVTLDGKHAPVAALELETPEPLFMRRVTVGVRDVRDLVPDERIIGSGTLYRVALDGAKPRAQLQLDFSHTPLNRELLVHIHNGDSPPLAVTNVRLMRAPYSLRFHATAAGTYTLLSGNPQATAPRYDLAALVGDLQAAKAEHVTPGPLQDMPGYQPRASLAETPLPDVPLTGAPLDTTGWTRRKPVEITAPGVQELELDPAALAGARTDFADLRLLRAGNQIPFILERTGLARSLTLTPEAVADAKRPAVSVWKMTLPHARLPLLRLALASDTPLFQRQFRLYEKVTAGDGRTYEHTLASGAWSRTPEPGSPRTWVFDLSGRLQTDTLYLETDNGDNPAIALDGVKAEHAVVRLVFKTAETDGYELFYGHDRATAPRYDLGLVARSLLTAGRNPARLGAEESDPEGFARGMLRHLKGGVVFWGALSLVVIVLLVVVARMLPKAEAPK
jgi:hypothetical protein